ncbi:MAG: GTP cyclohydrolase, partial [Flavobacteriaceae bacterium]
MEGPMGFSNLDKVGVLTYGYEEIGKMITWYNPPYYVDHFKKLNFKVEKEYVEHKFKVKDILFETHERLQGLIKKRYNLRALSFNKTKDVLVYADRMFDLFNDSFASLSSFVKIPDIQKDHLKKKFLSFINPEYIKFVINGSNELVAFSVIMPSYSTAFQKINGNIFPFGLYHIFKAKKSKTVDLYLIGVRPEYQKKGVHAIIFNEFQKTFEKHKISECRMTPVLADNVAMRNMWTDYKLKLTKKRCTFRKELK